MIEPVALSPLDSDRFGIKVARAPEVTEDSVATIVAFCERHAVELLIARCAGADYAAARALTRAGLSQLEAQITFRGELRARPRLPIIREAVPADTAGVIELARIGFGDYAGHYHADPRLPADTCRDVYVDWARRGIAGEASDVFFVAELEGQLCAFGFFTRENELEIRFELATVAPWARGQGILAVIISQAMEWGLAHGASALLAVVAHGTIATQRNFLRAGLLPVSATSTFHGWDLRGDATARR